MIIYWICNHSSYIQNSQCTFFLYFRIFYSCCCLPSPCHFLQLVLFSTGCPPNLKQWRDGSTDSSLYHLQGVLHFFLTPFCYPIYPSIFSCSFHTPYCSSCTILMSSLMKLSSYLSIPILLLISLFSILFLSSTSQITDLYVITLVIIVLYIFCSMFLVVFLVPQYRIQ